MIIAKEPIMSKEKTFQIGEIVTDQNAAEEARLLRLGVAESIAEETRSEDGPEVEAFREVLEDMTFKEQVEYAKKAGVDLGKAKTKKEAAERLLKDAGEKGVDIEAMSDGRLFFYAQNLGVDTQNKSREVVAKEIEALFDGE